MSVAIDTVRIEIGSTDYGHQLIVTIASRICVITAQATLIATTWYTVPRRRKLPSDRIDNLPSLSYIILRDGG